MMEDKGNINRAVEKFRKGEISLLKGAEFAEIPASLFVDELIKRKIRWGIGIEEFQVRNYRLQIRFCKLSQDR